MKRTQWLIGSLIATGLVLAGCAAPNIGGNAGAATESTQQTRAQSRVTAEKGTIEDRIIGTGSITANATVDVGFQSSGTLKEVLVKVGDKVQKDQPIASLDDSDLKLTAQSQYASYISAQAAYSETAKGPTSAQLKQAQAALASAQAAYSDLFKEPTDTDLVQAQADLQTAEADLKSAQAAYDRRAARDPGVGASAEALALEKATITYNKAKAAYDAKFAKPTNSAVASASAQIQQAKANLDALQPISETLEQRKAQVDQAYIAWQQAEDKVKKAVLTAPMAGLVTAVNFVAGASVGSGAAVAQIVDFEEPIFKVNVDEADLGNVKVGQSARVRLQTYPDTPVDAKVTSISPIGTNNGSITTYSVDLTIPQGKDTPTILLNMSGTGEIITTQIKDAVLVPTNALILNNKTYSVQKLGANGQIETVKVQIGARSGENTQIVSGVSAGDVLVIPSQTGSSNTQNGGFGGPPPGGPGPGGNRPATRSLG